MQSIVTVPALETPHLLLREFARGDVDELSAFMTQPRYQRHITHRLRDGAMVQDFVQRQVAAQSDSRRHVYHLAAEEKLSGDVIGEGFIIAHRNGSHELGWGIHPAMWSNGFGTEIGRALLALGFERLRARTMWSKVMLDNSASIKLAKRIGMIHKESLTAYALGQGKIGPVEVFSMAQSSYFDLPY
jgi:[ribosomal protein S5]-alanine N-acetyltransferase